MGSVMKINPFKTTRTLSFGDCDPAGIAYFPHYFHHLNTVNEEFFGKLGAPWTRTIHQDRIGFPTAQLNARFVNVGLHGDVLEWTVFVRRIGRASLDLDHEICARGHILWQASQTLVATSLDTHKPIPWPDALRGAFLALISPQKPEQTHADIPAT